MGAGGSGDVLQLQLRAASLVAEPTLLRVYMAKRPFFCVYHPKNIKKLWIFLYECDTISQCLAWTLAFGRVIRPLP